jgi:hypothetical protein
MWMVINNQYICFILIFINLINLFNLDILNINTKQNLVDSTETIQIYPPTGT